MTIELVVSVCALLGYCGYLHHRIEKLDSTFEYESSREREVRSREISNVKSLIKRRIKDVRKKSNNIRKVTFRNAKQQSVAGQ